MKTLRRQLDQGLERATRNAEETPHPEAASLRPDGWGGLLKSLLAVHVARSAQRVLERQAERPTAGRLGGEAGTLRVAPPGSPAAALPTRAQGADKAEPESGAPSGVIPIAKKVFAEFGKDNGTLMAAAVSFYLLLSLIPLLLLGASVVGFVLRGRGDAVEQVFVFLSQLLPAIQGPEIKEAIRTIINERQKIGLAGLAGVALTATGGFATLENAINALWNRPNRSFLMNKLYAFGMMLTVGVLFGLSLGITSAVGWAGRIPGLQWLSGNWVLQVLGYVLPILITSLMFTLIYRFYPNGRTGWKSSLQAGIVTAVLWEAFKVAYTLYTQRGDTSPYGVVVGLVMWIFYSSTLVLMGSELTWVLEGCPGHEGKDAVQSQRGR